MAVTFILGRAGTGKTRHCLDSILAELRQPGARRLILLVPEQASFQMERALATRAPGGGFSRAAVQSFSRFTRRVLAEAGPTVEVFSPQGRALALRQIAASGRPELRVLAAAAGTPGFYAALGRLIEELLAEDVPPEALRAAAGASGGAAGKVREIAELYAAYSNWLGAARLDAAGWLAEARGRLGALDWLRDASIWVDGFAGFTGQEVETLGALARHARDVHITLLVDPAAAAVLNPTRTPDPLGLFCRTEVTYQRLLGTFAAAGVTVHPPLVLTPRAAPRFAAVELGRLEAGLATPIGAPVVPAERSSPGSTPAPGVTLHECASHRDELRAAARWIRTRIADSGGRLRFRDFAVIARDLAPFAQAVAEVFDEFEIPYFLDRRRPLGAQPLARLVPALLETLTSDFAPRPTLRLLRTGLLPLSQEQAEALGNLVTDGAIRGAELWRAAAWEPDERGRRVDACCAERRRIMAAVAPLLAMMPAAHRGRDWARALYQALEELGVRQRMEHWIGTARAARQWERAELHRLAWDALSGVLQDVHDVLGDTDLTAGDVAAVVGGALEEQTLGLAPPAIDQVLVGSIERSRHPDVQYAWLFAFNEGVFPARPAEDRLLSTAERAALVAAGLAAPASHREDALGERLLAYIALTRASHGLVVSFAAVGDDGEAALPSSLLAEIRRAMPELTATRPATDPPPACLHELADGYLRVRRDERRARERRRYEAVIATLRRPARPALRSAPPASPKHDERTARLDFLLRGCDYRNEPAPVACWSRSRDRTADVCWDGSQSELETYIQCPFRHLARYGLRLEAHAGPQPVWWDLGTLAHRLLAEVTRRAMDEPGGVRGAAPERWPALLDEAVAAWRAGLPEGLAERRPEYLFLAGVLTDRLRDALTAQAARWRRGAFQPHACEQAFDVLGGAEAFRALELRMVDGRRLYVRGRADRIDVWEGAREGERPPERLVLVCDYKSSVYPLRGAYLTGARLQLLLYLAAVCEALPGGGARAAGALLVPLYPDLSMLDKRYFAGASPEEQLMFLYRPRGLVTEAAAKLLDPQLVAGTSPAAPVERTQKGACHRTHSDTVGDEELAAYAELARRTVLAAGAGLAAGRIDVAPLVEHDRLPCAHCDFDPVCRFDRMYNRPRAPESFLPLLDATSDANEEGGGA